jgi:hypothetical protein
VAGILTLRSPLLKTEVLQRLQQEAENEKQKDALSRIIRIEHRNDLMRVETTTQSLATHLGHAIEHAFKGELSIDKPPQADFVRVNWHHA